MKASAAATTCSDAFFTRGASPFFLLLHAIMSILNDKAISALAENDLFLPYFGSKQRQNEQGGKAVSFGLSQCGYDITLSDKQFIVYDQSCYQEQDFAIDPKNYEDIGYAAPLVKRNDDCFFVLPPRSMALGISRELISIPDHVMMLAFGKSTYARCGIILNVTPAEPGWTGHLTMNIANISPFPVRLYCGEGIGQLVLFDCGEVGEAYSGHYQNQDEAVTVSKVG
jgi:dCTP deaminase